MNRDSGTESANGGWLRRLVRPKNQCICLCFSKYSRLPSGNAVYPTTIQPSASGVFRTSILVLATVLYCHFVSWLVVQQPARKRLLTAIRSAMVFFIVLFLTPRLAYGFGLTIELSHRRGRPMSNKASDYQTSKCRSNRRGPRLLAGAIC